MTKIKVRTNSGIETQVLPLEYDFFQPFLPGLKPYLPFDQYPFGVPDDDIAEELADWLTQQTNQRLPINIDGLLTFCGATTISYHQDLAVFGVILEAGDDYFVVRLGSGLEELERKFTLGHELGHLVLHYLGYPISQYREIFRTEEKGSKRREEKIIERNEVESFCDTFSRMVLAPRYSLVPRFKQIRDRNFIRQDDFTDGGKVFLNEEVIKLFRELQLPPPDFVQRLNELKLWDNYNWPTLQSLLIKYQEKGII